MENNVASAPWTPTGGKTSARLGGAPSERRLVNRWCVWAVQAVRVPTTGDGHGRAAKEGTDLLVRRVSSCALLTLSSNSRSDDTTSGGKAASPTDASRRSSRD